MKTIENVKMLLSETAPLIAISVVAAIILGAYSAGWIDNAKYTAPEPIIVSLGEYEITAYCPCEKCCGSFSDGITASEISCEEILGWNDKGVAAPEEFPFGTKLFVQLKYKLVAKDWHDSIAKKNQTYPVIVVDRGSAIKGKRLDMLFRTHKEALEFGRVKIMVYRINERMVK